MGLFSKDKKTKTDRNRETPEFDAMFEEALETWSDKKCLFMFTQFFDRVSIQTNMIQNEDDVFVGEVLVMTCGDTQITSDPIEFAWPLQVMPVPESLKKKAH